jgi:hypothetical protein
MTSLLFPFITTLISFCTESFHSAQRLCIELLELFLLVAQSFCHCHSDRSLRSISFSICCAKRVLSFITVHVKQIHICIITTSQYIRKKAQSGRAVRSEPKELELINEDLNVRVSFEHVRCMRYCEKIQGYNTKLAEKFTLRFNAFRATIAGATFRVMEETMSTATEIPLCGERWYKGMPLDLLCHEDFIKPNC